MGIKMPNADFLRLHDKKKEKVEIYEDLIAKIDLRI